MKFLDRFKKEKEKVTPKKPVEKKKTEKKVEKKIEKKVEKKPEKKVEKKVEKKAKKEVEPKEEKVKERTLKVKIYRILKEPHITEKATDLTKENKYVFRVFPGANKVEVKKAVEDLYGISVLSVRIIRVPSKSRRLGRTMGRKKGYKKAIVKIKKGQKIELLPR